MLKKLTDYLYSSLSLAGLEMALSNRSHVGLAAGQVSIVRGEVFRYTDSSILF